MGTGASSGRGGPCVLHVLHRLDGDELGLGILDLARAIGRQGWRTVIACSGGSLAHEPNAGGAAVDMMPLSDRGLLARWRTLGRLAAAGKRHGVALVHAHEPSSIGLAASAAGRLGAGLVTTVHQSMQNESGDQPRRSSARG